MKSVRAVVYLVLCACMVLSGSASALDRSQLAVIVNTQDPLSVQIGEYYAAQRNISFQNFIRVSFPPGGTTLSSEEFGRIREQVEQQVLPYVQAYAITWAAPYRVDCMSITSAFTFGFNRAYCAEGCKSTQVSPYFNSPSRLPYTHHRMRPTMAIAATSFEHARSLIDRGVASDGSRPRGTAYLLETTDYARNVRSLLYQEAQELLKGRITVRRLTQNALRDKDDVLFYFTGIERVAGLETLQFQPGAIADHLTSAGGKLTDSEQMSALRWLEAGAAGSYGTVSEPCNLIEKFPRPAIVMARYVAGETLIEAYWKSVLMPGQGIFVGEPLATPYQRPNRVVPTRP